MKGYELFPVLRKMSWGEMRVISLGESGRGRWETLVPADFLEVKEGEFVQAVPTQSGKARIVKTGNKGGWIAKVSTYGGYRRGASGNVFVHSQDEGKVKVLASGNGAFGDAGRVGSYEEFLLEMEDNTLLYIDHTGRDANYYMFFGKDKMSFVWEREIEMFSESNGYPVGDKTTYWKRIKPIHYK